MTAHKKSHFQFHLFCYLSFPITRSSLTFSFLLFFTLSLIISSCFLSFPFLTSTNPSFSLFLRLSSFLLHFISFPFLTSANPFFSLFLRLSSFLLLFLFCYSKFTSFRGRRINFYFQLEACIRNRRRRRFKIWCN